MLNSDKSGNDASSRLRKRSVGRRSFIHSKFVLSVGPWAHGVRLAIEPSVVVEEPEDLIARGELGRGLAFEADDVLGVVAGGCRGDRDARTVEDDAQQRDRVTRRVRGFLRHHADGVIGDRARILFREIEKALEDTDEGDVRRMQLAALRYQERLARQDRPQEPATPVELPAEAERQFIRAVLPVPAWLKGRDGRPEGHGHRVMLDAAHNAIDNEEAGRRLPAAY
ncbi:hypothetical protein [Streptomyces coerulescens]|uniref:Uncharacterized protein n=1 Tax=Streptomyces coerulescens TaxID=29304 RepID=A0ABW0CCD1_STRCD